jgi:hypothetical protein
MVAQAASDVIPRPPGHPIIGNLLDLQGDTPLLNLVELAKIYGPIFRLELAGRSLTVLSSFELVMKSVMIIGSTRSWDLDYCRRGLLSATACSPPGHTSRTGKRRTIS